MNAYLSIHQRERFMKSIKYIFLLFLILPFLQGNAQISDLLISKVKSYPKNYKTIEDLSYRIKNDFKSDGEKAAAAYAWIAMNISYDINSFYTLRETNTVFYFSEDDLMKLKEQKQNELIHKTFKTRKGICEGYASLYKNLCLHLGLTSYIIKGYTRSSPNDIGAFTDKKNHAWNAVFYDNQWHLLDVTWGAGYAISKKEWEFSFNSDYFDSPPGLFINRHFPSDNNWQLLKNPINKVDFSSRPLIYEMKKQPEIIISLHQLGAFNLKPSEKNVFIHFEKFPKETDLSYLIGRHWNQKKIKINRIKNGGAIGYIKYRENESNVISLVKEDKIFAEFIVKQ